MATRIAEEQPGREPDTGYLLPTEAYTSEAWFAREQRDLFATNWAFAGMSADIPSNGDYLTAEIGPLGLFVVRDREGDLRAFHNRCRHRGARLLEGRGSVRGGISCFYHAWSYGLDGRLKGVPQRSGQFPNLDLASHGLKPAAVESFMGMMFVHPDPGQQGSLAQSLGDLPSHLGPIAWSELIEVHSDEKPLAANWKLFFENHIDGYHLYHLHRDSILGLDHDQQQSWLYGDNWSLLEPTRREGALAEFESRIPGRLIVDDPKWHGSSVHFLFPNLGIATGAKYFAILHCIPESAAQSRVRSRFFIRPFNDADQMAAADFSYVGTERSSEGTDFVAEDIRACEAIQRAMRAPDFEVGPMAKDFERSITHFQRSVLRHLGESTAELEG